MPISCHSKKVVFLCCFLKNILSGQTDDFRLRHPTRHQSFAGKLHSTFRNIWDLVIPTYCLLKEVIFFNSGGPCLTVIGHESDKNALPSKKNNIQWWPSKIKTFLWKNKGVFHTLVAPLPFNSCNFLNVSRVCEPSDALVIITVTAIIIIVSLSFYRISST